MNTRLPDCPFCGAEPRAVIQVGTVTEFPPQPHLTICAACAHLFVVMPYGAVEEVPPMKFPGVQRMIANLGATLTFCPKGHPMTTQMTVEIEGYDE